MLLTRRRAALAALILILVPLSCLQLLYRASTGRDEVSVTDGVLHLPNPGWPEIVASAIVWVFAITLAATILSGRFAQPIPQAVRLQPIAWVSLLLSGASVAAGWALVSVISTGGPLNFWFWMALAAVPIAYLVVRLALALPMILLEERRPGMTFIRPWAYAQGRTIRLALLLGRGILLPVGAGAVVIHQLDESAPAWIAWPARQVILVAIGWLIAKTLLDMGRFALGSPAPGEPESPPSPRPGATALQIGLVIMLLLPLPFVQRVVSDAERTGRILVWRDPVV